MSHRGLASSDRPQRVMANRRVQNGKWEVNLEKGKKLEGWHLSATFSKFTSHFPFCSSTFQILFLFSILRFHFALLFSVIQASTVYQRGADCRPISRLHNYCTPARRTPLYSLPCWGQQGSAFATLLCSGIQKESFKVHWVVIYYLKRKALKCKTLGGVVPRMWVGLCVCVLTTIA